MFETALLSLSPGKWSLALPLSIAAHAALLAAILGVSVFRERNDLEPAMPVILVQPRSAPPPAGSPSGTESRRIRGTVSRPTLPRHAASSSLPGSLPTIRPLVDLSPPDSGSSGEDLVSGDRRGVPGETGDVPGATDSEDITATPIPIGGDVRAPELLHRVAPAYPE